MRILILAILLLLPLDDLKKGMDTIKAADIQKHQIYIASDELEGREAGSVGGHKAAMYIVEKLQEFGLEPAGEDGSWFQTFGAGGTAGTIEEANVLRLFKDTTLKTSDDFKLNAGLMPIKGSKIGAVTAQIWFAADDDFKGVKKGEIVAIIDRGDWPAKVDAAAAAGAGAVVIIADELPKDLAWPGDKEITTKIPAVCVAKNVGEAICKAAAKDLAKVRDEKKNFRVARPVKITVAHRGQPGKGSKNLCAIWRGTDEKLKDEYVVVGAHYDHVGYGNAQSSRGGVGKIHNGADDDASGTCTLLDLAQALPEIKPKRSVVCLWFDGEESGLLGSNAWTGRPTLPLSNCVFMIQLDMIGRNDLTKVLVGVEKTNKCPKYEKLAKLLAEAEKRFNLKFDWDGADDLIQRSDHWNFMKNGIPAVFFTSGLHADYHTDKDDVDKINFQKEELIGRIAFFLVHRVANQDGLLK